MTIQIDMLPLGVVQTNCYIVGDSETKDAIIIDPSAEPETILGRVKELGYTVRQIIATHAHFDHVIASRSVKAKTGAPFYVHPNAVEKLQKMQQRAALFGYHAEEPAAEPDGFIEHGDTIRVASIHLEARYTPGHSPDHLMFIMREQQIAFVGDCIFYDGIGRTDFPDADTATLKKSIVEEILTLPDDFVLLSGHGRQTTVKREKTSNVMLRHLLHS
jgi:glyoxylase-like metal-dependent hydrolase (beta-lactamase superfamily II)